MSTPSKRPKYLNLFKIHMPVTAIASILHRVSGVWLILLTPVSIYALALSLRDAEGFAQVQSWLQLWSVRAGLIVAAWSLAHHLFAGIRYLFLDVGCGSELAPARASARAVTYAGAAVIVAVALWALIG